MGLLEDFETLEKQQTNSIEYYLYQLVLKDKHPINIDIETYNDIKNIEQDRVYIVVCGGKIHIGVPPVLKEIELNNFYIYLDLYSKQYPDTNVQDLVDWPLWYLIYSTYMHYDADFEYRISNNGDWSTKKNYRVKLRPQPISRDDVYKKYIAGSKHQIIKIDYSK